MNFREEILLFVLLSLFPVIVFSQGMSTDHQVTVRIPEVALLGLVSDGGKEINLNPGWPDRAWDAIKFSEGNSREIWINYSSVVSKNMSARKVTARIQGDMPEGLRLKVAASEYSGSGDGIVGQPIGSVELSVRPTEIIVDIGSCYTGKGVKNGHCLTYSLERNNASDRYGDIVHDRASVHVIYTLTD